MSKIKTITLNNILDIFKNIAKQHIMINDYGYGPHPNAAHNLNMPYMWVNTISASMDVENNLTSTYTIDCMIMDRVDKGDGNFQETTSDTNFILNTVIAEFKHQKNIIDRLIIIEGPISIDLITESTDNNVNGWLASFQIKVPIRYNPCDGLLEDCSDCGC